jgi:large subunit ribosomal protein L29
VKAQEIRELTDQGIQDELEGSQKELLNLRIRVATKQLSNTSEIGRVRKKIARLNTVLTERRLGVQ